MNAQQADEAIRDGKQRELHSRKYNQTVHARVLARDNGKVQIVFESKGWPVTIWYGMNDLMLNPAWHERPALGVGWAGEPHECECSSPDDSCPACSELE